MVISIIVCQFNPLYCFYRILNSDDLSNKVLKLKDKDNNNTATEINLKSLTTKTVPIGK